MVGEHDERCASCFAAVSSDAMRCTACGASPLFFARFRVLRGQSRLPQVERDKWPRDLRWALVERWQEQITANHGQTLERLHERGGLAPQELWCAAHGYKLRRQSEVSERAAGSWLVEIGA